jgi:hyperosmotically inducible periplasmic protein
MRLRVLPAILFIGSLAAAVFAQAQKPSLTELEINDHVRTAIQKLPYYGPYDIIGFSVSGTTVTLNGWVYQAVNKDEAAHFVSAVKGVTSVVNNIQVLPVSISDDKLRDQVFHKIYTDSFLDHYGTPIFGAGGPRGGRRSWGRGMNGFGLAGSGFGQFPGSEPVGNYAIHIIVKGGQVALYGKVDNDADKTKAGMDARGVFGVMGVENELQVLKD